MGELEKLSEKVVVPDSVVEKAAYIYRKSIPLISARRRSITTLVAASLYAACRSTRTPRTLKDIGEAANLDRLDIARSYRLLVTENDMPQPVDDPGKSVSRIAYGAGLSTKVREEGPGDPEERRQGGRPHRQLPHGLRGGLALHRLGPRGGAEHQDPPRDGRGGDQRHDQEQVSRSSSPCSPSTPTASTTSRRGGRAARSCRRPASASHDRVPSTRGSRLRTNPPLLAASKPRGCLTRLSLTLGRCE